MPSDFGFMKYSDPPLAGSSRDFFIPLTSNKKNSDEISLY